MALDAIRAIVALLFNLVPILMFGRLTGRPPRDFRIATILSACVAVLIAGLMKISSASCN